MHSVLADCGIDKKVISITADTWSGNNGMCDGVASLVGSGKGPVPLLHQIGCGAHRLSLVTKDAVAFLDSERLHFRASTHQVEPTGPWNCRCDPSKEQTRIVCQESGCGELRPWPGLEPEEKADGKRKKKEKKDRDRCTLVTRCRAYASLFRRSSLLSGALTDIQRKTGSSTLKIQGDSITRFHSTLIMMDTILRTKAEALLVLKNHGTVCPLSDSDWTLLPFVVTVLAPFKDNSELWSGQKYPTLSFSMPCIVQLLKTPEPPADAPYLARAMHAKLMASLRSRLGAIPTAALMACLLDPAYCRLHFLSPAERAAAWGCLEAELVTIPDPSPPPPPSSSSSSSSSASSSTSTVKDLYERCVPVDTDESDLLDELTRWRLMKPHKGREPLQWWAEIGQFIYPRLAILARRYLAIPASSIPCERLFSAAGNGTPRRIRTHCMILVCYSRDEEARSIESH